MKIIRSMFDKCIEAVSIGIFALMVLLVTFQVFVRYVLNSPSAFSETLTRYLFVWLVLITSTYAFGKRDHMCISYLKDKLPLKGQRMVNILIEAITFFLCSGNYDLRRCPDLCHADGSAGFCFKNSNRTDLLDYPY